MRTSASAREGRLRWELRGDARFFEDLRAELEEAARAGWKQRGMSAHGDTRVFMKYGPLRGKARVRHALRRTLGVSEFPRIQEFENLTWLRAHGFDAPRPIAAGVALRRALPCFQLLATEEVAAARTLAEVLPGAVAARRAEIVTLLGRELARLHALGFVHRDLFPRNLLLLEESAGVRLFFLDAWRGGPGKRASRARGPAYDLACLMLEGATLFERDEQRLFLHSYEVESGSRGNSVARNTLFTRIEKLRNRILAREGRRHREPFARSWSAPR